MPLESDEMRNFAEQSLRQENMEYDFPSRAAVSCIWRCTAEICDRLERAERRIAAMEEQVCDRLDKHLQIHLQALDTALRVQHRQQDLLPPVSESTPSPGRDRTSPPEPQENQHPEKEKEPTKEVEKTPKKKSTTPTNRRRLTKGKREASL